MKPKTMILMVVAVVCGLGASYMTSRLLADRGAPAPVNTVKVLVAKQRIAAWTPIKNPEDLFVEKEVPEGTFSPKCITDPKELRNQALKSPVGEQMPVTKDDLLSEATAGIIGSLQKGERAVAIRVTPESLVGGFVLPGSKVDVLMTLKRGDGDSTSQIIMQDMLVLAVDQKNTRDDGTTAMLGTTVTLAAQPEESERLSLAASLGDLRLLLRTPLDQDKPTYKAVHITDLPRGRKDIELGKTESTDVAVSSGSGTVTHSLRIESGDSVSTAKFVWDEKNKCWLGGLPGKQADDVKADNGPKSDAAGKPEESSKPKTPAPEKGKSAPRPPEGPVG
jgi:pilus assembly protein CpaB